MEQTAIWFDVFSAPHPFQPEVQQQQRRPSCRPWRAGATKIQRMTEPRHSRPWTLKNITVGCDIHSTIYMGV